MKILYTYYAVGSITNEKIPDKSNLLEIFADKNRCGYVVKKSRCICSVPEKVLIILILSTIHHSPDSYTRGPRPWRVITRICAFVSAAVEFSTNNNFP